MEKTKTGEESYVVQDFFIGEWDDKKVYSVNKDTDSEGLAKAKAYMEERLPVGSRPCRIIKRVETVVVGGRASDGKSF